MSRRILLTAAVLAIVVAPNIACDEARSLGFDLDAYGGVSFDVTGGSGGYGYGGGYDPAYPGNPNGYVWHCGQLHQHQGGNGNYGSGYNSHSYAGPFGGCP